jgi:hypothetical protein
MKKLKDFLCKIGFHRWEYSIRHLNLINRHGSYWKDCKWCKKTEIEEF